MTEQQMLEALGNTVTYIDYFQGKTVTVGAGDRPLLADAPPVQWSAEKTETLLDRMRDGATLDHLSEALGLPRNTIWRKIKRMREAKTMPPDCRLLKPTTHNMGRSLKPVFPRRPWTAEMDAQARSMLAEGKSIYRISLTLCCTISAVRYRLKPNWKTKLNLASARHRKSLAARQELLAAE